MSENDPIPHIEQLGYTPRESTFLYLVARNSGYFLARQFNWFLRRKAGALTQGFVNKLRANEHAAIIDYGQQRFVFHLKSKTIYRLLGIENSQNRRMKSDHEIRSRMMVLDYMLDRLQERFLSTEQEKVDFFCSLPGISLSYLPKISFQPANRNGATTERYFVERFPIAIHDDDQPNKKLARFSYFDEGAFTTKSFCSFLLRHQQLLSKVDRFALDYVALNSQNFASAQREFGRLFPVVNPEQATCLLPHGPEHLIHFFRAQRLWDENSKEFTHEDLAVLREGERLYISPEHGKLREAWTQSQQVLKSEIGKIIGVKNAEASFNTYLLEHSYPVFGYRNAGGW